MKARARILLLIVFAAIICLGTVFICNADSVASGTCGANASWTLTGTDDDMTLTISGYGAMTDFNSTDAPWNGEMSDITKFVVEDGITTIGSYCLYNADKLSEVELPNSVTSIMYSAFCGCSSLETVELPSTLNYIGGYAFQDCTGLTEISIPDSVTRMDSCVFYQCEKLRRFTFPDSMTYVNYGALWGCTNLTKVSIPDGVTSIEDYAFYGCKSLTGISLPQNLTSIGESAFGRCSKLQTITIPQGVTTIEKATFSGCFGLQNVSIPEGVTAIGESAFQDCRTLSEIVIPNGVLTIADKAFFTCLKLSNTTIPNSVTSIGENAFDKRTTININYFCVDRGSYAETYVKEHDYYYDLSTGHSYGDTAVIEEATCTEDGSEAYTCDTCKRKKTVIIPALGHDWNREPTVDKAATCTEPGSQSIHCSRCSEKTGVEEIPALGHDWNREPTVDKSATCTEPGSQSIHCSRCSEKSDIEEIAATGHTWNTTYTVDKEATQSADGSQSIHCSVCNAIKEGSAVSIPKLPAPVSPQSSGSYDSVKRSEPAEKVIVDLKAVKISKPKASKKAVTVKWKKIGKKDKKKIQGIEVQYSLDGFNTITGTKYAKKTKTSIKIKGLLPKKKYWVRIRAYRNDASGKHVSDWKVKTVKTR